MPIDITDPELSPMQWAAALTDEQLASQLARVAADVRCMTADERSCVLLTAANRLLTP